MSPLIEVEFGPADFLSKPWNPHAVTSLKSFFMEVLGVVRARG